MPSDSTQRPVVTQALHFGAEAARQDAAHMGMWVFLASEVMLFTGLFTAYALYRLAYPEVFLHGREHMEVTLGTVNTYVLITSSVFVALGIAFIRRGREWGAGMWFAGAVLLGLTFLTIKGVEYAHHIRDGALPGAHYDFDGFAVPGANLYFTLYWVMTGVHAVHVAVGVSVLSVLVFRTFGGAFGVAYHTPLELGGMYWHLVDLIWLFLWPLLYLV
ncbi:cytochrome c oxidase subunit 3 [Myxococcus stipitatus]|uniref:cytochrome c oxidase subunit 3 n=1 Tax=Myxococcus stipitatus TaxID=83455 RepID=UPI0030CCD748